MSFVTRLLLFALALAAITCVSVADPFGSDSTLLDSEAATIRGGACGWTLNYYTCDKVPDTNCPASENEYPLLEPEEDGEYKKGPLLDVKCNGCGDYYNPDPCAKPVSVSIN